MASKTSLRRCEPWRALLRKTRQVWRVSLAIAVSLGMAQLARAQSAPVFSSISALRQVVNIGGTIGFNTTVTSATPVTYQWKHNGQAIAGATASAYVAQGATPSKDGGWYQLVATNGSGAITSAPMFINVVVNSPQIVVWGDNAKGQANVPSGLSGVAAI